jgi:hypothetical protein
MLTPWTRMTLYSRRRTGGSVGQLPETTLRDRGHCRVRLREYERDGMARENASRDLAPPPPEHVLDHLARAYDLVPEDEQLVRPTANTVYVRSDSPDCDFCATEGARYDARNGGAARFACCPCYQEEGAGLLDASGDCYLMLHGEVPYEVRAICEALPSRGEAQHLGPGPVLSTGWPGLVVGSALHHEYPHGYDRDSYPAAQPIEGHAWSTQAPSASLVRSRSVVVLSTLIWSAPAAFSPGPPVRCSRSAARQPSCCAGWWCAQRFSPERAHA